MSWHTVSKIMKCEFKFFVVWKILFVWLLYNWKEEKFYWIGTDKSPNVRKGSETPLFSSQSVPKTSNSTAKLEFCESETINYPRTVKKLEKNSKSIELDVSKSRGCSDHDRWDRDWSKFGSILTSGTNAEQIRNTDSGSRWFMDGRKFRTSVSNRCF